MTPMSLQATHGSQRWVGGAPELSPLKDRKAALQGTLEIMWSDRLIVQMPREMCMAFSIDIRVSETQSSQLRAGERARGGLGDWEGPGVTLSWRLPPDPAS